MRTRFLPQGKSTIASPGLGISHHGERGSGASIVKVRCERSRHTRSASARRASGSVSGTRLARVEGAVEVGRVQANEGPGDLAVQRRLAGELAQLLALGGRGGREDDARAAHEGEGRRPEGVGGGVEGAVLHPQLEVLEAQRHTPRAPGLRSEREVDEAVDLPGFLPADDGPAFRALLHREPPESHLGPRLGRGEDLDVGAEPRRPLGGSGPPEEVQDGLVRGERRPDGVILGGSLPRAREVPQREPCCEVPRLPGAFEVGQERGRVLVGLDGTRASRGEEGTEQKPQESGSGRASRARVGEPHGGRPGAFLPSRPQARERHHGGPL